METYRLKAAVGDAPLSIDLSTVQRTLSTSMGVRGEIGETLKSVMDFLDEDPSKRIILDQDEGEIIATAYTPGIEQANQLLKEHGVTFRV